MTSGEWDVWGDFSGEPPPAHPPLGKIPENWTKHRIPMNQGVNTMTIEQVNETGETVADLSPEPKKRKGRPQPEDQKPTDPCIPAIGTDIWLCKKLECAISRHKHLTPDIERFLNRLDTWDLECELDARLGDAVGDARQGWLDLQTALTAAKETGNYPKVTARSRLRSWLRPGAPVALRDDIAAIYAQMYSQEELGSLEVMAVLETKVALRTRGGRELGLVELAHVRKP